MNDRRWQAAYALGAGAWAMILLGMWLEIPVLVFTSILASAIGLICSLGARRRSRKKRLGALIVNAGAALAWLVLMVGLLYALVRFA